MNKLIFGHLNVNSLRTKFDIISEKIKGSTDIFMVSETKLDDRFPEGQFLIIGFHSQFRFDRNRNGGGIMLYVREDILVKLLNHDFTSAENVFIEINLYKKKWLINCDMLLLMAYYVLSGIMQEKICNLIATPLEHLFASFTVYIL